LNDAKANSNYCTDEESLQWLNVVDFLKYQTENRDPSDGRGKNADVEFWRNDVMFGHALSSLEVSC